MTMVINTHAHYDHTNGQVEFPASVEVVAHANTKTYMEQANPVYGLQTGPQPNIFKEHGGRGMPARTFTDRLTLGTRRRPASTSTTSGGRTPAATPTSCSRRSA